MSNHPQPRSSHARIVFRVLGAVLLLAGLFLVVRGGIGFAGEWNNDGMSSEQLDPALGGFGSILSLAAGGFLVVFGLAALNAGFLGAQASYAAGETSGAVREFGSAFRGEDPQGGQEKSGAFCSECGVRGDRGALFCDACGHALAPR